MSAPIEQTLEEAEDDAAEELEQVAAEKKAKALLVEIRSSVQNYMEKFLEVLADVFKRVYSGLGLNSR